MRLVGTNCLQERLEGMTYQQNQNITASIVQFSQIREALPEPGYIQLFWQYFRNVPSEFLQKTEGNCVIPKPFCVVNTRLQLVVYRNFHHAAPEVVEGIEMLEIYARCGIVRM